MLLTLQHAALSQQPARWPKAPSLPSAVPRSQLVVTDVIMPGSSGPKLYERLSGLKPGLKVLYISGYTDDAIFGQGSLNARIEFLQKPFTAAALSHRVREILNRVSG